LPGWATVGQADAGQVEVGHELASGGQPVGGTGEYGELVADVVQSEPDRLSSRDVTDALRATAGVTGCWHHARRHWLGARGASRQ
jgi:hypothetical protein